MDNAIQSILLNRRLILQYSKEHGEMRERGFEE